MDLERLREVREAIDEALSSGKTVEEIASFMRRSGYTDREIRTAFSTQSTAFSGEPPTPIPAEVHPPSIPKTSSVFPAPTPPQKAIDPETLKKIREAIQQSLKSGRSMEDIKSLMRRANYSESEIDNVLSGVLTPASEELRAELSKIEMQEAPKEASPPKQVDIEDLLPQVTSGTRRATVNKRPETAKEGAGVNTNVCSKCGFVNKPGSRFCGGCGDRIYLTKIFERIK